MEKRESEIETAVGKFFLSVGFFCQKNSKLRTHGNRKLSGPLTLNGAPDLYLIVKGRYVGVEIKTLAGRVSDAQKEFKRRIQTAGGLYFVVRSMEDAENVRKALLEIA